MLIVEGGRGTKATDPYPRGCIIGALFSGTRHFQTYSLSANCINPDHLGATTHAVSDVGDPIVGATVSVTMTATTSLIMLARFRELGDC